MGVKQAKKIVKAVAKGFVEGINNGIDRMVEVHHEFGRPPKRPDLGTDEEIILTAEMLRELKWMGEGQLKAVFAGKKVWLDGKPETIRQMKWLGEDQLRAIFGRG